uniref:Uncharacterized protein n=1 Tax=Panagrolaimus superbus TaxID=310955 RepID=A0A914Y5N5_9BILA
MTSVKGSPFKVPPKRQQNPESTKTPVKINEIKCQQSPSKKIKNSSPPRSPGRPRKEPEVKVKKLQDEVKNSAEAGGDSEIPKVDPLTKFKEDSFNNTVAYLEATQWARTEVKNLYHKALDFYLQKVFPVCSAFSEKYKKKIAEYGRILTGIAFVNGDYYIGLTCAVTVLELLPLDAYMFIVVAKWSCRLREFDIFHKYDSLPLKYVSELDGVRNVCRHYSEFFKLTDTEKQLVIVDKLILIKDEILNMKEKTFFGYILKSVMAVPDFCDTQIAHAKLLFENGSVVEAESNLLSALYSGTLFAAPFRILQPLNALYYLKFRTINDKDKLKGLGAMIALLLGKLSDFKNSVEPYSRFRTDLLEDTYIFAARSDSESVLNKTLVSYVTTIPEHLPQCDCFLCFEMATNGSMYAEKQYSVLLIDGLSVESCNEFYSNVAYYDEKQKASSSY